MSEASNAAATVLIVEDDATLALLTRKQLAKTGVAADCVSNGREAIKQFKAKEYVLVLMDIQMPIMDGIEATMAMREWEKRRSKFRTPIVAMTANPDRQLCLDAGMDDFVFKPVMLDQLNQLLDRWCPKLRPDKPSAIFKP
ncbi:MAG TPA: response regulator [Planktothrix sp.]|jgi:polar amino acid transport system substrate-binding protein